MRNLLSVAVFSLLLSSVVLAAEPAASHSAAVHDTAVTHSQGVLKAWNSHKVSIAHPALAADDHELPAAAAAVGGAARRYAD